MTNRRYSLKACAVLLLLILGVLVVYFQPSERGLSPDITKLDAIASRMPNCPHEVGNWVSVPAPISEEEFLLCNLAGQDRRVFTNKNTGQELLVHVVVGTGRHATIHSLDLSYRYGGFSLVDGHTIQQHAFGETTVELANAVIEKKSSDRHEHLRVMWSFSDGDGWKVPHSPKHALGSKYAVVKVYFVVSCVNGALVDQDACLEFAGEYLPLLSDSLFGEEATSLSSLR